MNFLFLFVCLFVCLFLFVFFCFFFLFVCFWLEIYIYFLIETRNFLPFSQCEWQERAIQGRRDGACAVITILASNKAAQVQVEFIIGSYLCSEGFSPVTPVFLSPQKPTFSNPNSSRNARTSQKRVSRELFGAPWD